MKKFTFIFSTILLFSVAVFAQINSENSTEWKNLSPINEEFSADVPENIEASCSDDKCLDNKYSGKADGTYIFIFSDYLKSGFDKTPLKFVEVNQKAELEKQANQNEMKFIFSDDEDFSHTIYAVKTTNRAYVFHLISENKDDPNVKRFFKSLKINEKSAGIASENEAVEKSSEIETKKADQLSEASTNSEQQKTTQVTGTGQGSGRGSGFGSGTGSGQGSGFGNGIGSGNGIDNSSQESANRNLLSKDLNITFKPKPTYTDFARTYGIFGHVRVRVTFLKDGKIGSVSPVSRLPFGLTKSALETAKLIRFEPKTVNGQAVAVTKVVVFNFTIY